MHNVESRKIDSDEPICKAEIETQTQRVNAWHQLEKGRGWNELEHWD